MLRQTEWMATNSILHQFTSTEPVNSTEPEKFNHTASLSLTPSKMKTISKSA
jgi:hypothetical protein